MKKERILQAKDLSTAVVKPQAVIADVIEALESREVGALVVSRDGRKVDGIISERDVVRGLQEFGAEVLTRKVADLMTEKVITCTADDPIAGVMALMAEQHIRHVPVIDGGDLVGIVSMRDYIAHS